MGKNNVVSFKDILLQAIISETTNFMEINIIWSHSVSTSNNNAHLSPKLPEVLDPQF